MFVCPDCATTYQADTACPHDGARPLNAAGDPLLGSTIGSYRIAANIGSGGMGTVYRAVHPNIGSRVAIKVLSHDSARDSEAVNRFFDEARTVNLIRHDNIVNILDVARLPDGRPYIVMELLDGVSLKTALRQGPMTVAEVGRVAVAVLDALAAAHEHGVAHRDLKPDNIMVSSTGRVTLVDFGIAKIAGARPDAVRTETGVILGTPQYMSPEQAQGRSVDARTDIYAMGIVMYEMITGVRPFEGDSLFEILRQQISDAPRPPSQRAAVPAGLEQIILLAMAKAPEQRFASARAMQTAVRHATGVTLQTQPPSVASAASADPIAPSSQQPTYSAATANVRPPNRAAGNSPPAAHASSFSMVVKSENRTKKSTWLIAAGSVAIVAAVAIPISRTKQPSTSSPAPPTWLGSVAAATDPTAPVNIATTSVVVAQNSAALAAAIQKITSREELMIAAYSKDPIQAQAGQAVIAAQPDPAAPFVENDRLEIAIDNFAAYAYTRARSLAPDAQLKKLEFRGIRHQGLISVKGDFGLAIATFFSPRRLIRPAAIDPNVAWTALATITVQLGPAGTNSQWTWSTDDKPPTALAMPACKPSQLWNKARQLYPTIDNIEKSFGLGLEYETAGTWKMPHDRTKLADDCK